jgi:hypothetical protein
MPKLKNEKKMSKLNGQNIEVIIEQDALKDVKAIEQESSVVATDEIKQARDPMGLGHSGSVGPPRVAHVALENVGASSNDIINESSNLNDDEIIPPMPKLTREPKAKRITNKTLKNAVIKNMIDKQCDIQVVAELKELWGLD